MALKMRRYASGDPGVDNLDSVPAPKKMKINGILDGVVVNGITNGSKATPDGEKVLQMRKEHVGYVDILVLGPFFIINVFG